MMTGEIHYGALEEILIATAVAQMAKSYGAPTMVGGFGVGMGGEAPGICLDPAELMFTSMTTMAQTDFGSGIGGLDQAKGASLEQIVIDCDIWEQIREMKKEVLLDDSRFALDLVRSVGPGGNFLKEAHTARNMRKELFMPSQEKAKVFRKYGLDKDRKEMVQAARKRAKHTLATHLPEQVDKDTKTRIDQVLRKYQG
jgi:trimethylamine--corrinoid protein Co-methyltransferase